MTRILALTPGLSFSLQQLTRYFWASFEELDCWDEVFEFLDILYQPSIQ